MPIAGSRVLVASQYHKSNTGPNSPPPCTPEDTDAVNTTGTHICPHPKSGANTASPIQIPFSQACLSCLAFCSICFSDTLLAESRFSKSTETASTFLTTIPLGMLPWWNGRYSCMWAGTKKCESPGLRQPFVGAFNRTQSWVHYLTLKSLSDQSHQTEQTVSWCGKMHGKYFQPFWVGINDHQKTKYGPA